MEKIALFPASVETLPISRYINKYCYDKKITTLLAMPGTGLCGKDSSYADNRELTGVIVSESLIETQENWNTLYIANNPETDDLGNSNGYLLDAIIEEAYKLHKNVMCSVKTDDELFARYHSRFSDIGLVFSSPMNKYVNVAKKHGYILRPAPFTVFVGGIITEANAFEIFLSLIGEFKEKQNIKVLAFSTNPDSFLCDVMDLSDILYSVEYSEIEKVYMLNDYIHHHIKRVSPDIIFVHINESVLEYNENMPNGFGMYPFIISKSITPDFFVCGIPYQFGYTDNLLMLNNGILGKYDFGVDYFHLSNVEIDLTVSTDLLSKTILYAPINSVKEFINQATIDENIMYGSLIFRNYLENLVNVISSDLHSTSQLGSII
jgi:peptide maturation system protein (TIGR04066 family)